jgi:site-specific DNA recombinase
MTGSAGAEFANRPGFLRLMNALKPRPPFQVLVMSEESRLGREQIEVSYALKQIVSAGVRVFFYLEDRERTLDSPTDKIMLSLTAFADELEREKARQRTFDAMLRKAKAGHVTGGACFGYRNRAITGSNGERSHVERQIEPTEAEIVRTIFRLCADGHGVKGIAKRLNDQGAPSPRAQQGRSQTWAPTSVRAVLYRPLYRGEIVWSRTQKRDKWGRKHQTARPEAGWIRLPAPDLRIVTDAEWTAAHTRLKAARSIYFHATARREGRPALGGPAKYLLTNLALCGCCGGPLKVLSRAHGTGRKHFYGCAWHHDRGQRACTNGRDVPMIDANDIVMEALLDDVLDADMVNDSVDEALRLLQGDDQSDRVMAIEKQIAKVVQERARLVTAIATGGPLEGLLEALRARERQRATLEAERNAVLSGNRLQAKDVNRVRDELLTIANDWREVLANDPTNARPIVSSLLKGRVTYIPKLARNRWIVRGEGTLSGLFEKTLVALGGTSPTGFEPVFWP